MIKRRCHLLQLEHARPSAHTPNMLFLPPHTCSQLKVSTGSRDTLSANHSSPGPGRARTRCCADTRGWSRGRRCRRSLGAGRGRGRGDPGGRSTGPGPGRGRGRWPALLRTPHIVTCLSINVSSKIGIKSYKDQDKARGLRCS